MKKLDLITNSQEFMSKRILEGPKVTNFLAATVKNARIKRRLTLAQAVKNICSQSSWSKYENNYLTLPSEIVESVCEGMGLNYQELLEVNRINNLPECVKFYMYDRIDEVRKMYEYTNDEMFLSRDALIRSIYYLMVRNYEKFVLEIETLDNVKNTLSDYELLTMFICTIEYYIQINHFKEANKYLKVVSLLSTDDRTLEFLILQQKFIVSCNLRDYKTIHANYTDLVNATTSNYPIKKKILSKLLFLDAHPSEEAIKILDSMYYDIDESLVLNYWYTRLCILISLGDFYEAINKIISLELNHIKFVSLLGYAISRLTISDRNNKDLDIYKEKFEDKVLALKDQECDDIHKDFLEYIRIVISDQENGTENELNLLKNFLIPKMKNVQHRVYSPIYASRYTTLLGKKAKYKDAYLFSIDNCALINNLHLS